MNNTASSKEITKEKAFSFKDNVYKEITGYSDNTILFNAQKIVKAIYILTNVFPEGESIKFSIRQFATESFLELFKVNGENTITMSLNKSLLAYQKLVSLLDIVNGLEYISPANYDVLLKKINEQQNFIFNEIKRRNLESKEINIDQLLSFDTSLKEEELSNKDSALIKKEKTFFKKEYSNNFLEKKREHKKEKGFVQEKKVSSSKENIKDKRHKNILEILKQKKNASINDVCSLFKDCSAKTIQRDLKELIIKKKVMKKGERRWAVYNIV